MASKRRKIDAECRVFNDKWTEEYFFIFLDEKPICLICSQSVAALKEYNIRLHYMQKHADKYDKFLLSSRLEKIESLKKSLLAQQTIFTRVNKDVEGVVRASYAVSEIIARELKCFTDGEFVMDCIKTVTEILCPERSELISRISLSRATVPRRLDDMAENIEALLMICSDNFSVYSVCLDESTDEGDTAQLAIFVRGIDPYFNITEDLLDLCSMKGTTTGEQLFVELKSSLLKYNLPFSKLAGLTTDGAPCMVGKSKGVAGLVMKEVTILGLESDLILCHCIIHQENLCAKRLRMNNVMSVVVNTVNFIRSRALNHRQFKEFLIELDAEYGDVTYYSEVRWLSRGNCLRRFYNLLHEIQLFVELKGHHVPELQNDSWLMDLAFLVDITTHLNELNTKIQGKNQIVTQLYEHIKAFRLKLRLWERQLLENKASHFPCLNKFITNGTASIDLSQFAEEISILKTEFSQRMACFDVHEQDFKIFSSPFDIDVDLVPEKYQIELIELQCTSQLREKFRDAPLIEFYKLYFPKTTFPQLYHHALKVGVYFPTLFQQFFADLKDLFCFRFPTARISQKCNNIRSS